MIKGTGPRLVTNRLVSVQRFPAVTCTIALVLLSATLLLPGGAERKRILETELATLPGELGP